MFSRNRGKRKPRHASLLVWIMQQAVEDENVNLGGSNAPKGSHRSK